VRLFVAVFPSEEARAQLSRRLATARDAGVRLTRPERWHLTLHFLGEVHQDRRIDVEGALDAVPPRDPFTVHLAGGGSFGRRRSSVLWAGVGGDVTALAGLHDDVVEALGAEPGPLVPHLTVAYARGPAVRRALDGYTGPEWTVREFVLVSSHHNDGGGYENLRSWPLTG
jgi:2'-5' RNA ligase